MVALQREFRLVADEHCDKPNLHVAGLFLLTKRFQLTVHILGRFTVPPTPTNPRPVALLDAPPCTVVSNTVQVW